MSYTSGRFFRFFVGSLLLGIFIEFLVVISLLRNEKYPDGNIAVVDIQGQISASRKAIEDLKDAEENDEVKAIVVRVDTPGGTVGASQEIHDEIVRIKTKKPVVVSMGDVAASGGYYISAAANKIVANPGTLTGSLGVIATYFVFDEALKKLHMKWEVVKAGSAKDMGSPLRSLDPKERALLQALISDTHEQFIEAISQGRGMPLDQVKTLADGRIFSGRQAQKLGLVDELGSLEYAIRLAGKEAKVEEPKPIYPREERFSFLKHMSSQLIQGLGLRLAYVMP